MNDTAIRYLKGVGPRKEIAFNRLGVDAISDLLYYFPFRYEDRGNFKKIKDLKPDEFVTVKAKVGATNLKKIPYFVRSRKIKSIFEVILEDDTGKINCIWFNQAYLSETIKQDTELIIYGKTSLRGRRLQIIAPKYELQDKADTLSVGRIVGIYGLTRDFGQRFIRKVIFSALKNYCPKLVDPLPFQIRKEKNIPNIVKAIEEIHFPTSWENAKKARERFIFQELFFSQVLVYLRKANQRFTKAVVLKVNEAQINKIKSALNFELTSCQEQALSRILSDLEKPYPMHRLLQGDVGCGKTIVAILAIAVCMDSGHQAAFMVPTEVLAYQHKNTLMTIFKKAGILKNSLKNSIKVITSSLPKKELAAVYQDLEKGKIKVIIGTHSLIQEKVKFKSLGLVVVDEQHKFGVAQRTLLPKKGKPTPHCLVMSATPIPRSLALSLYGDLDLSVIKELPKGRIPAHTVWVKERKRGWVYNFLRDKLKEGHQAYIIYPLIEETENEDLKSLKAMHKEISREFPEFAVGVFHGKLKPIQKQKIIKDFSEKRVDILISTTVIEVGINIENATTMVVESPERFGLSQLHQLRGRIQRASFHPHFILISKENLSEKAINRLKVISKTNNGFDIAEEDLKLRGPGDFFGSLQHGLPDLKIANPMQDLEVLKQARSIAYEVIKTDPHLIRPEHRCIKEHIDSM